MAQLTDAIVAGRYKIAKKIGQGSFGNVYEALDIFRGDKVAVKCEKIQIHRVSKRKQAYYGMLWKESQTYHNLIGDGGAVGVPIIRYFGKHGMYNVLVMNLLGPSLGSLLRTCRFRFSMKTVLMLGQQMVQSLEFLHERGYIHRDIKPDNFVIGTGPYSDKIYLIDLGFATEYHTRTGRHIPFRQGPGVEFMGNLSYMSLNIHQRQRASRRDDLESVGYCLVRFLRRKLPWQEIPIPISGLRLAVWVSRRKMEIGMEELCKELPEEFTQFLNYCRKLKFSETPDYQYLQQLFKTVFERKGYQKDDLRFDWNINIAPNGNGNREQAGETGSSQDNIQQQPQFYVTRYGRVSKPPKRFGNGI